VWNNLSSCVNSSGCPFDDISTLWSAQSGGAWSYQALYSGTVDTWRYFCALLPNYTVNQPCYNSTVVRQDIARCDAVSRATPNNPFLAAPNFCTSVSEVVSCYTTAVRKHCTDSAAYDFLANQLLYQAWTSNGCTFDESALWNSTTPPVVGVCDVGQFSLCSYTYNSWNFAISSAVMATGLGQMAPNTVSCQCRVWSNFTSCLNSSGCTIDDVAALISMSSSQAEFNASVTIMRYICALVPDYEVYFPCYNSSAVRAGFSRCDAIAQVKVSYPFQYNYADTICTPIENQFKCYYKAATAACNSTAAHNLATYSYYALQLQGVTCFSDLDALLSTTSTGAGRCDDDAFYYCVSQLKVLNYSSRVTLDQFTSGMLAASDLAANCSLWSQFMTCVSSSTNCTLDAVKQFIVTQISKSVDWTVSGERDYFSIIATMQYICSRQHDYATYQPCYASTDVTPCDVIAESELVNSTSGVSLSGCGLASTFTVPLLIVT
jgi:hypothetical protein